MAGGGAPIGVLALQGDFAAHAAALERLDVAVKEVRTPWELDGLDGLVIPGGESTALLILMGDHFPLALRAFHAAGRPIYGTCAGLILLAREVLNPRQPSLGLIDVTVERNAYGRQRESFETSVDGRLGEGPAPFHAVFIRAPRIRRVGPGVTTLATLGDEPILAREGSVLVGTFHPELTGDLAVHRYFLRMAKSPRSPALDPDGRTIQVRVGAGGNPR
jgi:pyridoxal 5'-phosphate synthase pdxT subunit